MKETLNFVGQFVILWAVYQASAWIVTFARLPIPGNVLGVIVLFALLCAGVIKPAHVERAADFLLKHLVFFFMAMAVGLMEWWRPFADYGATLFLALFLSALLPLLLVGRVAQTLNRRRS